MLSTCRPRPGGRRGPPAPGNSAGEPRGGRKRRLPLGFVRAAAYRTRPRVVGHQARGQGSWATEHVLTCLMCPQSNVNCHVYVRPAAPFGTLVAWPQVAVQRANHFSSWCDLNQGRIIQPESSCIVYYTYLLYYV
jgi:hypothetical protein